MDIGLQFLAWDRLIKYVAGLNMFLSDKPPTSPIKQVIRLYVYASSKTTVKEQRLVVGRNQLTSPNRREPAKYKSTSGFWQKQHKQRVLQNNLLTKLVRKCQKLDVLHTRAAGTQMTVRRTFCTIVIA